MLISFYINVNILLSEMNFFFFQVIHREGIIVQQLIHKPAFLEAYFNCTNISDVHHMKIQLHQHYINQLHFLKLAKQEGKRKNKSSRFNPPIAVILPPPSLFFSMKNFQSVFRYLTLLSGMLSHLLKRKKYILSNTFLPQIASIKQYVK